MAYGLKPAYHLTGGRIRTSKHPISTSLSNNIYKGDLVHKTDAGYVEQSVGTAGTPTTTNLGVFLGCYYTAADGSPNFKPFWDSPSGALEAWAIVVDDPNVVYKIESDQDSTALTLASVGSNADWVAGTGSSVTGVSAGALDSSTITDGSPGTAQLRVLESAEDDQAWTAAGTPMDVFVMINEHIHTTVAGL